MLHKSGPVKKAKIHLWKVLTTMDRGKMGTISRLRQMTFVLVNPLPLPHQTLAETCFFQMVAKLPWLEKKNRASNRYEISRDLQRFVFLNLFEDFMEWYCWKRWHCMLLYTTHLGKLLCYVHVREGFGKILTGLVAPFCKLPLGVISSDIIGLDII